MMVHLALDRYCNRLLQENSTLSLSFWSLVVPDTEPIFVSTGAKSSGVFISTCTLLGTNVELCIHHVDIHFHSRQTDGHLRTPSRRMSLSRSERSEVELTMAQEERTNSRP